MPKTTVSAVGGAMPAASLATAPRKRITQPRGLPCPPDPSQYPDIYPMLIDGDCMQPLIPDRAAVIVQKSAAFAAGDVVCVWFQPAIVKPGMPACWLKRLALGIPPWVKFPYKEHPKSEVRAVGIFEQLNPPRNYSLACEHILTIHKAIGFVPPGVFADRVNMDMMVPIE